jgi:hypothetical protein
MDGQRFDSWTRSFTSGLSRRGTLKTLAGAALAGFATRVIASPIAADNGEQVGDYCDDHNPCSKEKGLVCILASCEEKPKPQCEGTGCKKKKKKHSKKGKRRHG